MFIILDHTAPQRAEIQVLKQELIKSLNKALEVQRQAAEMDDAQIASQYGIPAGVVAGFRTNIDSAVTALESSAITNIISSIGFDA